MLYVFVSLLIIILLLLFTILFSLLWTTVIGGVPYLPTNKTRITDVLALAKVKKGEKTVDLGSGDGRLVIAMARKGAQAHGYELNLFYVLLARWKIQREHLQHTAFIHWGNFFSAHVSDYDVITCYGVSYVMEKLEKKLRKEMKHTARIISISYQFKTWHYKQKKDFVFLYGK